MIQKLNTLLADAQVLYHKLRNYHWNVTGPNFFALHTQFETLYTGMAVVVDDLAERIRSLGGRPASTMKEYLALATLKEDAEVPSADAMVRNLADDYQRLTGAMRLTGKDADPATMNMLDGIADANEKTVWMLKANQG